MGNLNEDQMDDTTIKRLLSQLKCTVCGHRYAPGSTKVLVHSEGLWLLRVWCCECCASSLVVALIGEDEARTGIGDLTEVEIEKFVDAPPIGADDVLDVHDVLVDAPVDITSLFC